MPRKTSRKPRRRNQRIQQQLDEAEAMRDLLAHNPNLSPNSIRGQYMTSRIRDTERQEEQRKKWRESGG